MRPEVMTRKLERMVDGLEDVLFFIVSKQEGKIAYRTAGEVVADLAAFGDDDVRAQVLVQGRRGTWWLRDRLFYMATKRKVTERQGLFKTARST